MKKINRRNRIRKKRTIIIITILISIVFLAPVYAYMRKQLSLEGTATIITEDTKKSCDGIITYTTNSWQSGNLNYYHFSFTLTNNGDKDFNFWEIYFDVPNDSEILTYSSSEVSLVGTKLMAQNVSYNGTILPANSATFEVQMSTSEENYRPTNIVINNCYYEDDDTEENPNDDIDGPLDIKFVPVASYGNYTFQYDVTVTNTSTLTINEWEFALEKLENTKINNIWNANYIIKEDSIILSNMTYNGTISPGDSITFGIIIDTDKRNFKPKVISN